MFLKRLFGRGDQKAAKPPPKPAENPPRVAEPRLFSPGDVIGGEYKVVRAMRGGMGAVYVVTHHELDEPIILKALLSATSDEQKKLFRREAETWVALGRHPHVVFATFVRELHGVTYIGAEYIEPDALGRNSVETYLRLGTIPPMVVAKWIAEFAYGLHHALSHGMLAHRDIKPGNLMVDANGSLKISDFGLAKPDGYGSETGSSRPDVPPGDRATAAGAGTPAYMPPEQFLPGARLDHRADVYAMGVTVFQMLTGRLPFTATSMQDYFRLQATAPVPRTTTPFDDFIQRCLAKKPDDRYQTLDEVVAAVETIAAKLGGRIPRRPVSGDAHSTALYTKAVSYTTLGRREEAMSCIDEFISLRPFDYTGWTQKGRLCLEAGDLDRALDATKRSVELNELNSHSWNNLGVIYNRRSRHEDAVLALTRALEVDPRNTGAMLNLSNALNALGRHASAERQLRHAIQLLPSKATLWAALGAHLLQTDEPDEARESFEKALQLDPTLEVARQGLSHLSGEKAPDIEGLLRAGKFDEAQALLEKIAAVTPTDADAWHNLALLHMRRGRTSDAIRCFTHVVAQHPNDDFALRNLVQLHASLGHFEEGFRYCALLERVRGQEKKAAMMRAQLLGAAGRPSEGVALLEDLTRKSPEDDALWFFLGQLAVGCKQRERAISAFETCERLLLRRPEARENLDMVRKQLSALRRPSA